MRRHVVFFGPFLVPFHTSSCSFCKNSLSPISLDTILVRFWKAKSISYVCIPFISLTLPRGAHMTSIRLKLVERRQTAAVIFSQLTNKRRCHFNTGLHPLLWRPGLALTYYSSGLVSSGGLSLRMRAAACVATIPSRFEPRFFGDFFDSLLPKR